MDLNKIDQLLVLHGAKIPPEGLPMIREKLMNCSDETMAQLVFSQLKDPTLALILSIALGYWGIDRFYIGDAHRCRKTAHLWRSLDLVHN